jgi:hypothetical protein
MDEKLALILVMNLNKGQGHLYKTFSERLPFLNICKAIHSSIAMQNLNRKAIGMVPV